MLAFLRVRLRPYAAASLVGVLLLQGCAQQPGGTTPGSAQGTAGGDSFSKKVDTFSTVGEGAIAGAVAGGALGFLLGGQSGKSTAIGAGVGALVGGGIGAVVADTQKSFASREDRLNQLVGDAQKQNDDMGAMLAASQERLNEERGKVAALRAKASAPSGLNPDDRKQITQLKTDADLYDKAVKAADKRLDGLQKELAAYHEKYPTDDVTVAQASIQKFGEKRDALVLVKTQYAQLITANNNVYQ